MVNENKNRSGEFMRFGAKSKAKFQLFVDNLMIYLHAKNLRIPSMDEKEVAIFLFLWTNKQTRYRQKVKPTLAINDLLAERSGDQQYDQSRRLTMHRFVGRLSDYLPHGEFKD